MKNIQTPFYDPLKTYFENFDEGPFGAFGEGLEYSSISDNQTEFLGNKINLPFGIPAGPLLNSKYVIAALQAGFDLPVYKTVRTGEHGCAQYPNVIPVKTNSDVLSLEEAESGLTSLGEVAGDQYPEKLAITNSFGVPSYKPDFWQEDIKKAVEAERDGQMVIASYQGTNRGDGAEAFIEDHILGARLVKETGVRAMELNLSCPNEGTGNLLCYDLDRVKIITDKIKNEIGDMPLIIKLAYFEDQEFLEKYVSEVGQIVDAFSTINTIRSKVIKEDGTQALPGEGRLYSGVCGEPIKWAGLDMVSRLAKLRTDNNYNYSIVGVGGVTSGEHYVEYMTSGADAVMSATGAMWNPQLAKEILESVK